jgi:hypothetical protein
VGKLKYYCPILFSSLSLLERDALNSSAWLISSTTSVMGSPVVGGEDHNLSSQPAEGQEDLITSTDTIPKGTSLSSSCYQNETVDVSLQTPSLGSLGTINTEPLSGSMPPLMEDPALLCYHPINYGNQLMTWILWILSVSSVFIGN